MSLLSLPTEAQLKPAARQILDGVAARLGMVPNLYSYIAHSPNALESYLEFQTAQAGGSFRAREREAVYLAVSEANGCVYCQAAHTALGKMNGFTEEETLELRSGNHPDRRLGALTRLAAAITTGRGRVATSLIKDFFGVGYDEAALIDLVTLVADKTLANYLHNMAGFEVDFPAAQRLESMAAL